MPGLRSWVTRERATTTEGGPADGGTRASTVFTRFASLLPDRDDLVVVVVTDDHVASPVLDVLASAPRAGRLIVISPEGLPEWELDSLGAEHQQARTVDEVNWLLRFVGPVDAIVDVAARTAEDYDALWWRTFFHLRPRGVYAVDRRRSVDGEVPPVMLSTGSTVGLGAEALSEAGADRRGHRFAVFSLTVDADHVVLVKRGRHLLKVRDKDASRILPAREPGLLEEVLATRPGGTLQQRARIHSHESGVEITALDEVMEYPAMALRHYRGRIAMVSNALLHTQFTALPDSFRHHLSVSPGNPRLISVSGDFARVRPRDRPQVELPGTYYHLDSENSGHFGHLLTEVTGRLWGWDEAKRQIPDLKAIFRIRHAHERKPELEQRWFSAYGIEPDDICWVDEPVWLESVVAASPMWHNQVPHYVHPDLLEVWDRLRSSVLEGGEVPLDALPVSGGRKVFVSRQDITTNRACRNTREVEDFFRQRGFDVLYPEQHDLSVQAAIFDNAAVVAGFGGSAMFNIMFSRHTDTVILLNHEAYTARNEHLYTALLGGDVHYFWSTPDLPHPEGGWSEEAYYSPWAFDFERNTGPLEELLASL